MLMCRTGKLEYPNVRAARTALHNCHRARAHRDRRREQSFYRCTVCKAFHLTSERPHKGQRFT